MSASKKTLTPASRERVISQANFFNSLASSLFATGVLGTLGAMIVASSLSKDSIALSVIFGVVCFAGCFGLHILAQRTLGDLDEK